MSPIDGAMLSAEDSERMISELVSDALEEGRFDVACDAVGAAKDTLRPDTVTRLLDTIQSALNVAAGMSQ